MGQKINPRSMRLQVDHDWQSRWYADRDYASQLIADLKIRKAISGKLSKRAGVARVDIERSPGQIVVTIHTSKPGVVIGRAMKMSVENAMKGGALGARVAIAGRLNGAEMARRESVSQGSIPQHTLRADIDYAQALARTTYGVIGVKVWVYKGTKFEDKK
jgi:small subunit ribosomal protein S3